MPATSSETVQPLVIAEAATAPSLIKSCTTEICSHLNLLQVARAHNDRRLVSRVLQHLPETRRKLTANILINLLQNQNGSISGN